MDALNVDILRDICAKGSIKWTEHALKRIRERKITSSDVIDTIIHGEAIMHYHDDKPFPSWLIYNGNCDAPIHIVASTDGSSVYFITAYVPTSDEWENNFITRKERK